MLPTKIYISVQLCCLTDNESLWYHHHKLGWKTFSPASKNMKFLTVRGGIPPKVCEIGWWSRRCGKRWHDKHKRKGRLKFINGLQRVADGQTQQLGDVWHNNHRSSGMQIQGQVGWYAWPGMVSTYARVNWENAFWSKTLGFQIINIEYDKKARWRAFHHHHSTLN